jgi:hypothetical protein
VPEGVRAMVLWLRHRRLLWSILVALATLLLKVEAGASLARAREAVRGILDRVVKSPECKGVTILCDVDPQ